jgi:large subunit ribosomal protein L32
MGIPSQRRTSSSRKRRAAHFALKQQNLAECPKCKAAVLPHRACANCGTYAGRQVTKLKSPVAKSKGHDHQH